MSILVEFTLKFVYDRTTQKRAGILRDPNTGVEGLAIFFVQFGKGGLKQYCNILGDVAGKVIVRGHRAQAATGTGKIARDVKPLPTFFSLGSTILKSEHYLLLLALLYPAVDQMEHPCVFNVLGPFHTLFLIPRPLLLGVHHEISILVPGSVVSRMKFCVGRHSLGPQVIQFNSFGLGKTLRALTLP